MDQQEQFNNVLDDDSSDYERICAVLSIACLAAAQGDLCRPDQQTLTIQGQQWVHTTAAVLLRYVGEPAASTMFSPRPRGRRSKSASGVRCLLTRWLRACGFCRHPQVDQSLAPLVAPPQAASGEIGLMPPTSGLCRRCFSYHGGGIASHCCGPFQPDREE